MMSKVTINFAIGLILLGVGTYIGTGTTSITALIPAFIGAAFLVLGILARREHLRKHVMHAAAMLALITIIMTFSGVIATIRRMSGSEIVRPEAALAKAATCFLSIVYLGLCVNSFIQARRSRITL